MMRIPILILIIFLGVYSATSGVEPSGYLSISAGETIRQVNNADSPLTGIYHFGVKGTLPSEYWEIGVLVEGGVFNHYPALGSIGEVKIHCPLFQENLRVGVGGGIDFQSYFSGDYRGQFGTTQEYAYRIVPMVIGQVQVFKKTFVEYQRNFDETIFWKIRIGFKLWG
jgi:hypothetical protein